MNSDYLTQFAYRKQKKNNSNSEYLVTLNNEMHIIGFMMVYCRKNHVQSRAMHAREFCPKPNVAARVTQSRLTVPLHTSDLAFIFPHFHSYNLHYI